MKLIYVEWEDAASNIGNWMSTSRAIDWAENSQLMKQSGYLISKTKDYLLIGSIYSTRTNEFKSLFKVPAKWIKKMLVLNIK